MVKSSSCFKLITCGGGGGDSGDKDGDYQPISENKDTNDKRGWSFRKRSARHRVLSNTVITETPSSANKEGSESTSINFPPVAEPDAVEKTYTTNVPDEKPQLSSLESSQIPETIVTETESKVDVNPPESDVIVIQAAIRGFLARRALLKNKNAVKLQAAVRGHLVRKHAVGTLRCVKAIAKMQVFVRARHAQQGEHPVTKSNVEQTSIEKLLSNRFARQLLESTPKNKPINVKCDPLKGDSAWRWLERWMSVSSAADFAEIKKEICAPEQSEEIKEETKESNSVSQLERGISTEVSLQSADSKPTVTEPHPLPSEDKEKNKTTYDVNSFSSEVKPSTSSVVKDNIEEAYEKTTTIHDTKVTSTEIDSFKNEKTESGASVPQEPSSINQKPEIDGEQDKQSKKRFASDQPEAEGKKFVNGSRKTSNPAFIAVQSKFEELTSANSGKSSSLSNQDAAVESQADTSSFAAETAYRSKELFSPENSATYPSIILGSECGTELSITSTLDSPDGSEVGVKESEHDAKDSAEGIDNPEIKTDHGLEADKIVQANSTANLPNINLDGEDVDYTGDNKIHLGIVGNSDEVAVNSEQNASDQLKEPEEAVQRDSKLSPEASPRSQQYQLGTPSSQVSMTIPESQETPSSQVSIKSKGSKTKKTGSGNRRRILSSGNKSPANNANHDSGSKEQLPKDQSSGKRRSSFGSAKPDEIDQEARDNSGSNNNSSIPRFMLATESARAKMNANNSPRSSPDVHDQDALGKKRQSLPGTNGRQGSPRVQRSPQQNTKGNGVHVHHERKWQR